MDLNEIDITANPGAFSSLDIEAILPELEKLQPGDLYLEVGVDKGRTLSIAKMVAKDGVKIIGVDINKPQELVDFLSKYPDVQFIQGESVFIAKQFKGDKISVLFIDGDHSYEGCSGDLYWWTPHLRENAVIFLHDCDESSPGVVQAAKEYITKNKVKEFTLFKTPTRNTSMALIRL